ncbi:MAG: CopD family protein, partial [Proteobacteria bacterium]|nr:CopD family protein [Pseudomonadota bacterium]
AGRHSAERDFLNAYWSDVFDALKRSGIGSDVMTLVGSFLGEEQRTEVDRLKKRATQLLNGVDWKAFGAGKNKHDEKFFRKINEVPSILLIIIVIMVVVRPF